MTNWAVQPLSIVSLCLQAYCLHQFSREERFFLTVNTDCRQKMSRKISHFEFSWISRRDRVGFANCLDLHMHRCATVSASNFQALICSDRRASTSGSFIRFMAGPARVILHRQGELAMNTHTRTKDAITNSHTKSPTQELDSSHRRWVRWTAATSPPLAATPRLGRC